MNCTKLIKIWKLQTGWPCLYIPKRVFEVGAEGRRPVGKLRKRWAGSDDEGGASRARFSKLEDAIDGPRWLDEGYPEGQGAK